MAKLKLIETNKIAKEIIWANQRYFKYANKPRKLLANLITPKKQNNAIPAIKNKQGEVIRAEKEKRIEFMKYYEQLYESSNPNEISMDKYL